MRHSVAGDLGLTLERGNVPNDYFGFCFRIRSIKVGVVGEGEGVAPLEGVAEEKSLAKFESDCFESVFNPAARFLNLEWKSHLKAEAIHGFLLVMSESWTWAGESSPSGPR